MAINYAVETIKSKTKFGPRSFRTVVSGSHRVTVGCPKGYWDDRLKLCRVGTQGQRILHPKKEVVMKNPCPLKVKRVKKNDFVSNLQIEIDRMKRQGMGSEVIQKRLRRKYNLSELEARRMAGARIPRLLSKRERAGLAQNPSKKWYVGKSAATKKMTAFQSSVKPTHYTHAEYLFVTGPFESREKALGYVRSMSYDYNPTQKEVEIYENILAIEAQKGKKSNYPGEKFRHDFSHSGTKVLGLPDGSLKIISTKGKKLWKKF